MSSAKRKPQFSKLEFDGQKLRVAHWAGPKDSGNLPILYFNGIGSKVEEVFPLADKMAEREIISFDMPGIGGSSQPVLPYTIGAVASLAAQLLDRLDIMCVDIIGLSWGGAIAQQFALQHGDRVGRMVLKATSTGMLSVPGDISALSREISSGFEMPSIAGFGYQLMAMAGWTSAPFLPFMDKQTLIMMGTRDDVVPIANGHMLKMLIPNSRLYKVKGGGHMFTQSHLDETVHELRAFLTEE